MDVMDEIAIADNAGPWLDESLADRRKIMGFGHRVYKNGDSRVPDMRAALEQIAALRGGQRLLDIYETLAKAMHDAKGLHPKPRLPRRARLPPDRLRYPTFTPIFVAARLPGWTAHITEQLAANSLIRPLAAYGGPAERHLT
jgi:citrate synthase